MGDEVVKSKRLITMTREQDLLLRREARRRNIPEYVVLREVLDAGFAAKLDGREAEAGSDLLDAIAGLADGVAESQRESRAQGLAIAGWASWASFAAFEMLRAALQALGKDPDGEGLASGAMSRFMSSTDCNVPTRIWESAGRRMAGGDSYREALVAACRENGVEWEEFSGSAPKQARGAGSPDKEGGRRNGRQKKNRNR